MRRLRALPWKKILLLGPLGLFLLLLIVCGVAYAVIDIPAPNKFSQTQTTVIRYSGGEEMARLGTNRELVPLSQMSEPAQKAVLAAEDRGFYTEPGISPKGILRALFTNVRGGGSVQQGGSTITQQYAKNVYLSSERTYTRKIKEVFISLKMTRQRSKEQILEDYLNTIYFGRGAYGIQAASKAYFGPSASAATLTAEQGAVLASSIRSPAGYDPAKHPDQAKARWAYVLDGMVAKNWLPADDRVRMIYPEVAPPGTGGSTADLSGPLGHVVDAVQGDLLRRGFAEDAVEAGGLDVTTTIDQKAEDAAIAAVEKVDKADRSDDALQGALVAVVPGDGAVRAYYGGANGSGLDYAGGVVPGGYVVRQPGSSMKPYVLATALAEGVPLSKTYDSSSPQTIAGQTVRNAGGEELGRVDLSTGLAESLNTVYYRLAVDVGPKDVAATAHAAGIPDDVLLGVKGSGDVTGQIALGAYPVHVTDQASGYSTFASGGVASTPYVVAKVVRDGETVFTARPQTSQAMSAAVAADTTYAMRQVVTSGTGTRARLASGREAAGKTGTTTGPTDVWFSGFTPQLSTTVWFGYGDNRDVTLAGGSDASGGAFSAPAWKSFMDTVLSGQPELDFPPRADVGRSSQAPRSTSPAPSRSRSRTPSPSASRTPSATPSPTDEPSSSPSAAPSETPTSTPTPRRTPTPRLPTPAGTPAAGDGT